jgi:hypothetical protein
MHGLRQFCSPLVGFFRLVPGFVEFDQIASDCRRGQWFASLLHLMFCIYNAIENSVHEKEERIYLPSRLHETKKTVQASSQEGR